MTGYHLRVGYQSGASGEWNRETAWEELKRVVEVLRQNPEALASEARRLGCPEADESGETLLNYARQYEQNADLTLRIVEVANEDEYPEVYQAASGGGVSRTMKEHLRRAFCRLVIEAMHGRGIEVCLVVA